MFLFIILCHLVGFLINFWCCLNDESICMIDKWYNIGCSLKVFLALIYVRYFESHHLSKILEPKSNSVTLELEK